MQTALLLSVSAAFQFDVFNGVTHFRFLEVQGALQALPDPGIMVDESYDIHLNMRLSESQRQSERLRRTAQNFETMQQHSRVYS